MRVLAVAAVAVSLLVAPAPRMVVADASPAADDQAWRPDPPRRSHPLVTRLRALEASGLYKNRREIARTLRALGNAFPTEETVGELIRWLEYREVPETDDLMVSRRAQRWPASEALGRCGDLAAEMLVNEHVYFVENRLPGAYGGRYSFRPGPVREPSFRLLCVAVTLICSQDGGRAAVEYAMGRMKGARPGDCTWRACRDLIEGVVGDRPKWEAEQLFPAEAVALVDWR